MEVKNLVSMVLAVTVGIICVGSIMVPVLSDAMITEDTFTNEGGLFPMIKLDSEDTEVHTLVWERANEGVIVVDGVDFNSYTTYGVKAVSVLASDEWLIRYFDQPGSEYIQLFDGTNWISTGNVNKFEMSVGSGDITITRTNSDSTVTTYTDTYEFVYMISTESATDLMKGTTDTPYVKKDTDLYAMGVTTLNGDNRLIKITGNIEDGVSVSVIGGDTVTISDVAITYSEVSGYVDLCTIEKITFNATINDTTTACTYSYFIVPYEVTAERAVHFDSAQIAMIAIIPLLVIVAVLMIAVRAVNRD